MREALPRWLASFSDLAGVVVLHEPRQRLWRRLKREYRRVGALRLLDVFAFRLWYRLFLRRRNRAWERTKLAELCADLPTADGCDSDSARFYPEHAGGRALPTRTGANPDHRALQESAQAGGLRDPDARHVRHAPRSLPRVPQRPRLFLGTGLQRPGARRHDAVADRPRRRHGAGPRLLPLRLRRGARFACGHPAPGGIRQP